MIECHHVTCEEDVYRFLEAYFVIDPHHTPPHKVKITPQHISLKRFASEQEAIDYYLTQTAVSTNPALFLSDDEFMQLLDHSISNAFTDLL